MLRLVLAGFVFLVGSSLWAQQDTVYFLEPGKKKEEQLLKGRIEQESPTGLQLKTGSNVRDIPAAQITQITYHCKVPALDFRKPDGQLTNALKAEGNERAKLLSAALAGFKALDAQLSGEAKIHRYLQYRIALTLAARAKDDPASRDSAIAVLKDNKTAFTKGWEAVPALQLLARLQEEKNDTEGASQTYAELADVPGLDAAMKLDSQLRGARLLLSARKFTEAESKLKTLTAALPADDPQRTYVAVYLAQSRIAQNNLDGVEKTLKDALASSEDKKLRGLVHNALGDYYYAKKEKERAFWEYLKVDTLYNEDREEQAKALFFLSELFDTPMNDPTRAEECRAKLQSPQFEGAYYQRRASENKKKP
jgi:predicted negative regulator of RcsB-dependent stress response